MVNPFNEPAVNTPPSDEIKQILQTYRKIAVVGLSPKEERDSNAPILWMQLGVIHNEAAQKAKEAGLTVVMDRCIMDDHKNLFPKPAS